MDKLWNDYVTTDNLLRLLSKHCHTSTAKQAEVVYCVKCNSKLKEYDRFYDEPTGLYCTNCGDSLDILHYISKKLHFHPDTERACRFIASELQMPDETSTQGLEFLAQTKRSWKLLATWHRKGKDPADDKILSQTALQNIDGLLPNRAAVRNRIMRMFTTKDFSKLLSDHEFKSAATAFRKEAKAFDTQNWIAIPLFLRKDVLQGFFFLGTASEKLATFSIALRKGEYCGLFLPVTGLLPQTPSNKLIVTRNPVTALKWHLSEKSDYGTDCPLVGWFHGEFPQNWPLLTGKQLIFWCHEKDTDAIETCVKTDSLICWLNKTTSLKGVDKLAVHWKNKIDVKSEETQSPKQVTDADPFQHMQSFKYIKYMFFRDDNGEIYRERSGQKVNICNAGCFIRSVVPDYCGKTYYLGHVLYKGKSEDFQVDTQTFKTDADTWLKDFVITKFLEVPEIDAPKGLLAALTLKFNKPPVIKPRHGLGWYETEEAFCFPRFYIRNGKIVPRADTNMFVGLMHETLPSHIAPLDQSARQILQHFQSDTQKCIALLSALSPTITSWQIHKTPPNLAVVGAGIEPFATTLKMLGLESLQPDKKTERTVELYRESNNWPIVVDWTHQRDRMDAPFYRPSSTHTGIVLLADGLSATARTLFPGWNLFMTENRHNSETLPPSFYKIILRLFFETLATMSKYRTTVDEGDDWNAETHSHWMRTLQTISGVQCKETENGNKLKFSASAITQNAETLVDYLGIGHRYGHLEISDTDRNAVVYTGYRNKVLLHFPNLAKSIKKALGFVDMDLLYSLLLEADLLSQDSTPVSTHLTIDRAWFDTRLKKAEKLKLGWL